MERSGTLSGPSDNSTTPYIKKRPTLLGQPLFLCSGKTQKAFVVPNGLRHAIGTGNVRTNL